MNRPFRPDAKRQNSEHPLAEPLRKKLRGEGRLRSTEISATSKDVEMEKGLEVIYREGETGLADLTTMERRTPHLWLRVTMVTIMTLLIVGTVLWGGNQWAHHLPWQEAPGFEMDIRGPSEIALGREERFEIQWKNVSGVSLEQASIRLGLPPDFIPTSFAPAPMRPDERVWQLGQPFMGATGTIILKGVFVGALGSHQAMQVIGSYRIKGSGRDRETLSTQPVTYTQTLIVGTLISPVGRIVAGDPLTFRYAVSNQTEKAVDGLLVRVMYPSGFLPSFGSSTEVHLASREWIVPLPRLLPHATTTIALGGFFSAATVGDASFEAEGGRRGLDGSFLPMTRSEMRLPVAAGDLALHMIVNGTEGDRAIPVGETLRVTIGYQNTSQETLRDVGLVLGIESMVNGLSTTGTSLIAWNSIEDGKAGDANAASRIQTIRYTKRQIPLFAALAPRAEGVIELSLPTRLLATGTRDAIIRLSLDGTIMGDGQRTRTISVPRTTLRYRTDATVLAEARYFTEEGAPLGFGPLPPVAGKTTTYRVFWHVTKSFHPVEQIEVSAVLPSIALWSGKSDTNTGTIRYDAAARTVRWIIPTIPDGAQTNDATFELQLTPEIVDIGRFASLLGETLFLAKDLVADASISQTKPALTTDLSNDEGARRKGVVRKE